MSIVVKIGLQRKTSYVATREIVTRQFRNHKAEVLRVGRAAG